MAQKISNINSLNMIQTGKESDLNSKCPKCGKPLYGKYKIFGIDRIVPISCDCQKTAYEKAKQAREAKDRQARLKTLIKNSLMDSKFSESTFENWNFQKGSKQMHDLAERYSKNFQKCKKEGIGLLIYGEPGNGKTFMVSCIANYLLQRYVPTICVSINSLLERIQETYRKYGSQTESDVLQGLKNADLLILDDLGTENISKNSDWTRSMIYNIIDNRYRSKLPLIITSNLNIDPQETNGILAERYGRRTEDRILEMCTPILNTAKGTRISEAKKHTDKLRNILYGGNVK